MCWSALKMGNLLSFSKTMEENMKKNQEFITEMNKVTVSNVWYIYSECSLQCLQKSATGPVMRQIYPVQMCQLIHLKIHFKIILPPMPRPYKLCFCSGLATEMVFFFILLTCMLYWVTTCPDFCRPVLKVYLKSHIPKLGWMSHNQLNEHFQCKT